MHSDWVVEAYLDGWSPVNDLPCLDRASAIMILLADRRSWNDGPLCSNKPEWSFNSTNYAVVDMSMFHFVNREAAWACHYRKQGSLEDPLCNSPYQDYAQLLLR